MGETIWTLNIKRGGIVMGNVNDWYCACERALNGNKCDWCKEAIYTIFLTITAIMELVKRNLDGNHYD